MIRNLRSWWRRWLNQPPLALRQRPRRRPWRKRLFVEVLEDRWLLSAYVVTSTADDGSAGTLRAAINAVNAGQADEINFHITGTGVQTINLTSALPAITADGFFINGRSEITFQGATSTTPLIELNGANAGSGSDGLLLDGSNGTVSGLIIEGFLINNTTGGNGIEVAGSNNTIGGTMVGAGNVLSGNGHASTGTNGDGVLIDSGVSGVQVQGNYIGTNTDGSAALGNGNAGIVVSGNDDTIGGTMAGARNVISGNGGHGGILIAGSGVVVQGNYIGTDITGTVALGNGSGDGIQVSGNGGNDATIGGTSAGAGNVISGNSNDGVFIQASGVVVQGNFIGTNAAGTSALGNYDGVVDEGSNDTLGGTTPTSRNIISGNSVGILLGSSRSFTANDVVQGNYIGTDITGSFAVANGIGVSDGGPSMIGGTSAGARNVISGNTGDGVLIYNGGSAVVVQGNYIGLNAAGTSALSNSIGVDVHGPANTIGGTVAGARNVISGNVNYGVLIHTQDKDVVVQGNYIGTDHSGQSAVANHTGIAVQGSNNTIGGTSAGARNVISGNDHSGITIASSATGTVVQGNYVGVNVKGAALANGGYGVSIAGSNNTIGGSVSAARNTIADNSQGGIFVSAGNGDTLRHNLIYANGGSQTGPGIVLTSGTNNNLAAPNLSMATLNGSTLTVTGSFTVPTANVSYVLEFFANPTGDPEGTIYLGSKTVTPKHTGTSSFTFTKTTSVTGTDPVITATLTDATGDTSIFSGGVTTS